MSQIVHITFEKLTGLPGAIDGTVMCNNPHRIDTRLPLIFDGFIKTTDGHYKLIFRQGDETFYLFPILVNSFDNYTEHFRYGTNFLIKEWSYGSGFDTGIKNPN